MSRVGKHPVPIPSGVTVNIDGQRVEAKGKLGALQLELMNEVAIEQTDSELTVRPRDKTTRGRMMWGTARTLVSNLVTGVSEGFTRQLEIHGVGYRAQVQGKALALQLGFSHDVRYPVPEGISITCSDPTHITIHGADKQRVGQVAADIRSYRPVEPYKGKGIRYSDEFVLRKEGKKK
ncbi:MAG: 50S ribosomal protein L6 [Hyphomicrobiales bacterium]|nr:50S ribosomal protein L6 [Hyphomicrobiales bacterium]